MQNKTKELFLLLSAIPTERYIDSLDKPHQRRTPFEKRQSMGEILRSKLLGGHWGEESFEIRIVLLKKIRLIMNDLTEIAVKNLFTGDETWSEKFPRKVVRIYLSADYKVGEILEDPNITIPILVSLGYERLAAEKLATQNYTESQKKKLLKKYAENRNFMAGYKEISLTQNFLSNYVFEHVIKNGIYDHSNTKYKAMKHSIVWKNETIAKCDCGYTHPIVDGTILFGRHVSQLVWDEDEKQLCENNDQNVTFAPHNWF